MSFDVILPFLRPIAHLIQDPDVSEIMINGSRRIFIERQGLIEAIDGIEIDERNLKVAVKNIARALGDDVSEEKPILDSRLPDGSRVAAVFPPCSVGGTTLTIRKFQTKFFTADELVRIGTMTPEVLAMVRAAIASSWLIPSNDTTRSAPSGATANAFSDAASPSNRSRLQSVM